MAETLLVAALLSVPILLGWLAFRWVDRDLVRYRR